MGQIESRPPDGKQKAQDEAGERPHVLYVDDEVINLMNFKLLYQDYYHILTAKSAREALQIIEKEPRIKVVVGDQRMPGKTGVELFEELHARNPRIVKILLTGYSDVQVVIDAINKGHVYYYVSKPYNEDILKHLIDNAAALSPLSSETTALIDELRQENRQLKKKLEALKTPAPA